MSIQNLYNVTYFEFDTKLLHWIEIYFLHDHNSFHHIYYLSTIPYILEFHSINAQANFVLFLERSGSPD